MATPVSTSTGLLTKITTAPARTVETVQTLAHARTITSAARVAADIQRLLEMIAAHDQSMSSPDSARRKRYECPARGSFRPVHTAKEERLSSPLPARPTAQSAPAALQSMRSQV